MLKKLRALLSSKHRGKLAVQAAVDPWALDTVLIAYGKDAKIRVRELLEGVFITGGIGSGKTSGSGRLLAIKFLLSGFGGLVVTAKIDECELWRNYCAETGRLDDLIVVGPNEPHLFNFLDYEIQRNGEGAGYTENVINIFTTVIEVAEKSSGKGGQGGEQYWARALRQLLRNLTDLLIFSTGRVTVPDLYQAAVSAPTSLEQIQSEAWKKRSFCFRCMVEADKKPKTQQQKEDFALVADYFMLEWPTLSEKTRSVVLSTFTSMADVLNRGVLKRLFCGETTITPKAIEDGKIIVVNLPVKEFGDVGLFANILWKNSFQRSIERRDVRKNPRPVFLWQDEAQLFWTDFDNSYQSTARSARAITVAITQNISNLYAVCGDGQKGKAQTDSLIGNLNLKIFHGNGDPVTNQWCADLIGKSRQYFFNGSNSNQTDDAYSALFGGGGSHSSGGFSEQMEYQVQPTDFLQMRNGGPANDFIVDGLLFSSVMRFGPAGKNFLPVTFRQQRQS